MNFVREMRRRARGVMRAQNAAGALSRLAIASLLLLVTCSQHDNREPLGMIANAVVDTYPFKFRWNKIVIGQNDDPGILVSIHFNLQGAINNFDTVAEVFECGAHDDRPCTIGNVVRIPEDMNFGQLTGLISNNIRKGTLSSNQTSLDLRMTVRGPGDPVVDIHVELPSGAITARAPSGSAAAIHTPGRRAARAPRWWRSHSTHTIAANGSRP